jgi:hypothetical protein
MSPRVPKVTAKGLEWDNSQVRQGCTCLPPDRLLQGRRDRGCL